MRNKRLLTYGVLTVIFLLLQSGFGEEPDLVQNKDVTAEISLDDSKTQQAEKHAEKIKQYLENLIFRIQEEDTETGELPEAGFSIVTNNLNLEKLIITGEKGRKYLFSLLKETKSGYTKERILREIYKDTADSIRILYGGSVKPENIDGLMSKPNIDGALVGGASLKADDFARIVKYQR